MLAYFPMRKNIYLENYLKTYLKIYIIIIRWIIWKYWKYIIYIKKYKCKKNQKLLQKKRKIFV